MDDAIRVVVATAGIPADEMGVRAELHEGIGAGSTWEGVAVLSCADERIDE